MAPLLSIIVPVYRTEAWLRRCADSLLSQTLRDLELILVDDGSPDGAGVICDEYAARDGRVRVLHKENGGVMSAVNAGLRAAAGAYVGFADSDDWVDPTYYEDLYRTLRDADADVAVAEHIDHGPDGDRAYARDKARVWPAPDGGRELLYAFFRTLYTDADPLWDVACRWDKLYRRERLTAAMPYFDEAVWHGEDMLMNAAVLAGCGQVAMTCGGGRYHYLIRPNSASHDRSEKELTDRWAQNELAYLRALGRVITENDLAREPFLYYLGRVAYAAILNTAGRRDLAIAAKRRYARQVLDAALPGALAAYARRRGPAAGIYCRLLEAGAIGPCVFAAAVFGRLKGRAVCL